MFSHLQIIELTLCRFNTCFTPSDKLKLNSQEIPIVAEVITRAVGVFTTGQRRQI